MPSSPDLKQMLEGLIAIPSISSVKPELDQGNLKVIQLLAKWLDTMGFSCEILPLPNNPDKANLIATLGEGPGGLVLAGHTDTVPYDEGRWKHDPFKLIEQDNRFYGLGTSDMKSFLGMAIEAVNRLESKSFHHPLIILATADEESSMDGARELVRLGKPKARYAVIGEPTGMKPIHAHKGMMMESIRLIGKAGHSSDPALGNNAIKGMHKVLGVIESWQNELQMQHQNPLFHVPYPTINLGHIHGGDNPNRICGECEMYIDIRPLPGMDITALQEELQQRVFNSVKLTGLELEIRHLMKGVQAMNTNIDSAIVKTAESLTRHSTEAAAYSTEGPFLNELGMDTIILGPGAIEQAHQPDEFLHLNTINPMISILQGLIKKFCLKQ
ncbi:MAG: acetylornithine deacetylase [Gammaproteobacteria bacterium]|nr:acetylornithine deacetylase [Gammaproteobacteria bacterium]